MPKHEYESLRDEDKAWAKLQRPLLLSSVVVICLVILVSAVVSLKIVFSGNSGKRSFCSDRRLQPLPTNGNGGGGDSDLFPGAFYRTDQQTVDYYWMVVFVPSVVVFLSSVAYHGAGITVSYSAPARHSCLKVVEIITVLRKEESLEIPFMALLCQFDISFVVVHQTFGKEIIS